MFDKTYFDQIYFDGVVVTVVSTLKMIPKRPWNRMSRLYKSLSLKGG
jgi:hypothetical protein